MASSVTFQERLNGEPTKIQVAVDIEGGDVDTYFDIPIDASGGILPGFHDQLSICGIIPISDTTNLSATFSAKGRPITGASTEGVTETAGTDATAGTMVALTNLTDPLTASGDLTFTIDGDSYTVTFAGTENQAAVLSAINSEIGAAGTATVASSKLTITSASTGGDSSVLLDLDNCDSAVCIELGVVASGPVANVTETAGADATAGTLVGDTAATLPIPRELRGNKTLVLNVDSGSDINIVFQGGESLYQVLWVLDSNLRGHANGSASAEPLADGTIKITSDTTGASSAVEIDYASSDPGLCNALGFAALDVPANTTQYPASDVSEGSPIQLDMERPETNFFTGPPGSPLRVKTSAAARFTLLVEIRPRFSV